jgi:hypothetical protein
MGEIVEEIHIEMEFPKAVFGCCNLSSELSFWNFEGQIHVFGWPWNWSLESDGNSEPCSVACKSGLENSEPSRSETLGKDPYTFALCMYAQSAST